MNLLATQHGRIACALVLAFGAITSGANPSIAQTSRRTTGVAVAPTSVTQQAPDPPLKAPASILTTFTYQGQLKKNGAAVTSLCQMAFRAYDAVSAGAQVGVALTQSVAVTAGLFTTPLDFGIAVFTGPARWLNTKVKCVGDADFVDLGRQLITAAPYALYAQSTGALNSTPVSSTFPLSGQALKWDGNYWTPGADQTGVNYGGLVVVARIGGNYTSIQAAIDSVHGASAGNPYLVWVAPGTYSESITMKPNVHLAGAGQNVTIITSSATNLSSPYVTATLVLTAHVSVRNLSIYNGSANGTGYSIALLAPDGAGATIADATVSARGTSDHNAGIRASGSDTDLILEDVTATATNASGYNTALYAVDGPSLTLEHGTYTGRGGSNAYGLYVHGGSGLTITLNGTDVTALGEQGSGTCAGVYMYMTRATLRGGSYTGHGCATAYGIDAPSGIELYAEDTLVSGSGGTVTNYGLYSGSDNDATLREGQYTGQGGANASGIFIHYSALNTNGAIVKGSNASSNNFGLYSEGSIASLTLQGGQYSGVGGAQAYGAYIDWSQLSAVDITVEGWGAGNNYGLYTDGSGANIDVSFSRISGDSAYFDGNYGTGTVTSSRLSGPSPSSAHAPALTCTAVTRGTSFYSTTCP
jgi:hypothetical protein